MIKTGQWRSQQSLSTDCPDSYLCVQKDFLSLQSLMVSFFACFPRIFIPETSHHEISIPTSTPAASARAYGRRRPWPFLVWQTGPGSCSQQHLRGHSGTILRAMVPAWPFTCLPVGVLMKTPHLQTLKALLDGLDVLITEEPCPR